ncbi:MAG: ribose 5-phosphate isomerase B [Oscillospiraceae bacterium]|nr:ribose 5-phosphate isomerase B [Oscillospiraceae bacterium]
MIAIASDHGGFALKKEIMERLEARGLEYKDFGSFTAESCDYPDLAAPACRAVRSGECEKGILICGTGIGMSISANKIKGIRAALCGDCFSAEFTRRHNDANVLCLGARVTGAGLALKICDTFLDTPFEGGRHKRRIEKVEEIEREEAGL